MSGTATEGVKVKYIQTASLPSNIRRIGYSFEGRDDKGHAHSAMLALGLLALILSNSESEHTAKRRLPIHYP